jgi:hypothetical protein
MYTAAEADRTAYRNGKPGLNKEAMLEVRRSVCGLLECFLLSYFAVSVSVCDRIC